MFNRRGSSATLAVRTEQGERAWLAAHNGDRHDHRHCVRVGLRAPLAHATRPRHLRRPRRRGRIGRASSCLTKLGRVGPRARPCRRSDRGRGGCCLGRRWRRAQAGRHVRGLLRRGRARTSVWATALGCIPSAARSPGQHAADDLARGWRAQRGVRAAVGTCDSGQPRGRDRISAYQLFESRDAE